MARIVRLAVVSALSYYYHFLRLTLRCFLLLFHVGEKKIVPPPRNPILFMSASRLASSIRLGKLLSEDVVKCYIQRIQEVQPYINAVAENRYEQALEEAKQVDQIVASKTKSPEELAKETPLLGVPVTAKLLISVKGMRCSGGSYFFKDDIAQEDADVITRLKKAGAIILATTNAPEFGMNIETFNWVYGMTNNPYDTRRTPGGSSGGEAALISAAGSVLGIGNDLGGSIRFPCHFTGIFGHKPTNGIVSYDGMVPKLPDEVSWHVCTGPMCRYAEDLALCMKILLDPEHSHMKIDAEVDFSKIKVYYFEIGEGNNFCSPFDKNVLHAQRKVIAARGMDPLTMAFAREIEEAFGGWVPPNATPEKQRI